MRELRWGRGDSAPVPDGGVLELFARQVTATPRAGAVHDGPERLSYEELDGHSWSMAAGLREHGIRSGDLVGVQLPMSARYLIVVLALWKISAAYIPLDATDPIERRSRMLLEAKAAAVVVSEDDTALFPEPRALRIDRLGGHVDRENQPGGASADSTAYVIGTSGSTGIPKGVLIGHRALGNYVARCAELYPVGTGERVAVHTSPAFDLTITSFLYPLTVGAELVIVPAAPGVDSLVEALTNHAFGLVKMTPTHYRMLQDSGPLERTLGGCRQLVIGGERLVLDHPAPTVLVNEYGPTEATVGCVVHRGATGEEGVIPIGRPIGNTHAYILDEALEPVTVGIPGQLYIGGAGLADGYVNRAGLTADAFIPDPFSRRPGARMYRTGDAARWRADGEIEFLGRMDSQVKIRGYRVELGEIEYVVGLISGVRDVVATTAARKDGAMTLRVYYTTRPGGPTVNEVESALAQILPGSVRAGVLTEVDAIPFTRNGKVDTEALAQLDPSRPSRAGGNPPATPLERGVAEIWRDVLDLDEVDVMADFFDLGGESLLAAQIIARIRRELGVDLPLVRLFEKPTVRGLAAALAPIPSGSEITR